MSSKPSQIPRRVILLLVGIAFVVGFMLNGAKARDFEDLGWVPTYRGLIWGLVYAFVTVAGIWIVERIRNRG